MMKLRIGMLVLLLAVLTNPSTTRAGFIYSFIVGLSTEITQIANNVELFGINLAQWEEVAQQVVQLEHEVVMIENQLKNLETLVDTPLPMINTLEDLSNVVQRGQVLSYAAANIENQIKNMHTDFAGHMATEVTPQYLEQQYIDWGNRNRDNITAALNASGIQEETIVDERARLETIVEMSKTSEGRLQAIQAGNLIASEQVESLQKLRQLIMTSQQFHANDRDIDNDKAEVRRAAFTQGVGDEGAPDTTNGTEMNSIDFR